MRLIQVQISNYRNIDGISVDLDPEYNYIIGENNLGKSNFLNLLNTVCNGKAFDDEDFFDVNRPIEVKLTVNLLENELGFFNDNFSPEDASILKIRYRQEITDAYPTIVSAETNESISPKSVRKINFFKYESTAIPSKELRFDSRRGTGLLMNGIIERFISNNPESNSFLNDQKIQRLLEFINHHLEKIKGFRDYSIKATVAPSPTEMLTRLFYFSDGERRIDSTGSGVQFIAMASINILCQITELYQSKSIPFEDRLYVNDCNSRILPLVLSIDEPEVHLHPFLQRSLISYYKRILHNQDADFVKLLRLCFGIDGVDGQLIIITHSTDALLGNYRNIVRFYKSRNRTSIISGANPYLSIKKENEKHLIMHFPEIKEAFYAHCALLIEGVTEYGCISAFADKINISLDDEGISVINGQGEKSIKPIRHLLDYFAIPSIAIYDGDVQSGHVPNEYEFFTSEKCFEIEIVKSLYQGNRKDIVRQIAIGLDDKAESTMMDTDYVKKPFNKMGINLHDYIPKKLSEVNEDDEKEFVCMYAAWFMSNKGVLLGRIIGDMIPANLIPNSYSRAIQKAKEVAQNG